MNTSREKGGESSDPKRERIDWESVRRSMEEAARKVTGSLTHEEREAILSARARVLSGKKSGTHAQESIEVLEFMLGKETYAFRPDRIKEIFPLKDYTPLPCTPDFVLGITNVRRQILSIIDLRKFFNLPCTGIGELNKVIVLGDDDMMLGILADSILGMISISRETMENPPDTVGQRCSGFITSVTSDGVIVLDANLILHDRRIIVNEHVNTPSTARDERLQ